MVVKRKLRLHDSGALMCRCGLLRFLGTAVTVFVNEKVHGVFSCDVSSESQTADVEDA